MKKKSFYVILGLFLMIASFASKQNLLNTKAAMDVRAVWISYLDFGGLKDKSQEEFTNTINTMYDQVLANNCNTVIVHVKPFHDAIYPSQYYGWSAYITSNPSGPGYNPLQIMIEQAHNKGLRFEAWMNPYRVTTTYSRDPGDASVREQIVASVDEIVRNYDVDGIHFDDYFYINGDTTPIDQKKANVNELIRNVYARIKAIKPNVVFGISPQGNIDNCRNTGADVDTWLSNSGYIDYITPQLYWSDNYGSNGSVSMYSNRLAQWKSLVKNNVKLYVGLALYKVEGKPADDPGWTWNSNNLLTQVHKANAQGFTGYFLFRHAFLNYDSTQQELINLRNDGISQGGSVADKETIKSFVDRLYRTCLSREPDEEGLNYWINHVAQTGLSGPELARRFIFSPELFSKRLSNEDYIETLYVALMGRGSDAEGKAYWLSILNGSGDKTSIFNSFAGSPEFKGLCQNYGIGTGIDTSVRIIDTVRVSDFVSRFYMTCMGREADEEGLAYWTNQVSKNGSAAVIIQGFILSPEFQSKNLTKEEFTSVLYRTFFDREGDPEGISYWVNYLGSNSWNEKKNVLNGFMNSAEFKNLCNQYGISPGSL